MGNETLNYKLSNRKKIAKIKVYSNVEFCERKRLREFWKYTKTEIFNVDCAKEQMRNSDRNWPTKKHSIQIEIFNIQLSK